MKEKRGSIPGGRGTNFKGRGGTILGPDFQKNYLSGRGSKGSRGSWDLKGQGNFKIIVQVRAPSSLALGDWPLLSKANFGIDIFLFLRHKVPLNPYLQIHYNYTSIHVYTISTLLFVYVRTIFQSHLEFEREIEPTVQTFSNALIIPSRFIMRDFSKNRVFILFKYYWTSISIWISSAS